MKKAVEILKNGIKFMEQAKLNNPLSISELDGEIQIYQEAIDELEVDCSKCLHFKDNAPFGTICSYPLSCKHNFKDKYEAKTLSTRG